MDHRSFMQLALDLASQGRGYTSPNPMVGAVVVRDGNVVGKGFHAAAGAPHAEVNAIDDAGAAARGATLYVTLEPCNHIGRTPPCTQKILEAGIREVVVAMEDPNPDVSGGGIRHLRQRGVVVLAGVCERSARRLNEGFVKFVATKIPFVIVKCAATLDGRIATRTGDSKWVTGAKARQFVHQVRHAVDAILVGIGTVQADDPSLTTRLEGVPGRDPVRIVLDTHLSISEDANVLRHSSHSDTIIAVGEREISYRAEKIRRIEKLGSRVMSCPQTEGAIDLKALMPRLGALGITSLLIEGGGRVIASAFRERVVDKVNFFYAPKVMGGDDGVPICSGPGPRWMRDCTAIDDLCVRQLGQDVLIEGYVSSSRH